MIRLARAADAAAVAEIYRPVVAGTAISFEIDPPDAAEMERRILSSSSFAPWLVLDEDGVAGYAYASRHRERAAYRWSVDASVYVRAADRRRGVGRALYSALFELLRVQGPWATSCARGTTSGGGSWSCASGRASRRRRGRRQKRRAIRPGAPFSEESSPSAIRRLAIRPTAP